MKYRITVNNTSNFQVSVKNKETKRIIDVSTSNLSNIDSSMLNSSTDHWALIYDAPNNKYIFISPSELLGYGDNDSNPNTLDYGTY